MGSKIWNLTRDCPETNASITHIYILALQSFAHTLDASSLLFQTPRIISRSRLRVICSLDDIDNFTCHSTVGDSIWETRWSATSPWNSSPLDLCNHHRGCYRDYSGLSTTTGFPRVYKQSSHSRKLSMSRQRPRTLSASASLNRNRPNSNLPYGVNTSPPLASSFRPILHSTMPILSP